MLADDKQYFITQPGSSVATSLIEGEAKEKKIGILHIREAQSVYPILLHIYPLNLAYRVRHVVVKWVE